VFGPVHVGAHPERRHLAGRLARDRIAQRDAVGGRDDAHPMAEGGEGRRQCAEHVGQAAGLRERDDLGGQLGDPQSDVCSLPSGACRSLPSYPRRHVGSAATSRRNRAASSGGVGLMA
jgi:hypothetical protein